MFVYVILEAIVGVVLGILLAVCTKRSADVTYGKLDRAGQIINILLIPVYGFLSPFYMFLGMICEPYQEGFLWVVGGIVALFCGSTALFCSLGLGASVALRKKGRRTLSFAAQFAGVIAIALTVLLYLSFVGSLLSPLN